MFRRRRLRRLNKGSNLLQAIESGVDGAFRFAFRASATAVQKLALILMGHRIRE